MSTPRDQLAALHGKSSDSTALRDVIESGQVEGLPLRGSPGGPLGGAPKGPPGLPPPMKPGVQPKPMVGGGSALSLADQLRRKGEKLQKAPAKFETVEEELVAINEALERDGFGYRVPSVGDMRAAKVAAGSAITTGPVTNFEAFSEQLKLALRLGALGGGDGDGALQRAYVEDVLKLVVKALPRREAELRKAFTTIDSLAPISDAVADKAPHQMTAQRLAEFIVKNIGTGLLAGIFPGESREAKAAEGGKGRIDKMVDLGRDLAEYIGRFGNFRPEVTGSLILSAEGYKQTPDDLDVNVTTTGSDDERKEQWEALVDGLNEYPGTSIVVGGGRVRVYPISAGRLHSDNAAIWERRYAYAFTPGDGGQERVMPFEVEVKDVGGAVWKEHLKEGAPPRETDGNGESLPQWLMLDTMTRILGHRNAMKKSAAKEPDPEAVKDVPAPKKRAKWIEVVAEEGLKLSRDKHLWEKLSVAIKAASAHPTMKKTDPKAWLRKVVKDPESYGELLDLTGNKAYEKWLSDIG